MSIFSEAVKNEIIGRFEDLCVPHYDQFNRHERYEPSIHIDIKNQIPDDLTAQAVIKVLEETLNLSGSENPSQEAGYILQNYNSEILLIADTVLDRLNLVGTANDQVESRLAAITNLIDLNRRLGASDDFKGDGLLGVMTKHRTKLPLFFDDLEIVFDKIVQSYSNHIVFDSETNGVGYNNFRKWNDYAIRDSIIGVAGNIVKQYGEIFDEKVHERAFGATRYEERYILPGVSSEEFMTELCNRNIKVANEVGYKGLGEHLIPKSADNWRAALEIGCEKTIDYAKKRRGSREMEKLSGVW